MDSDINALFPFLQRLSIYAGTYMVDVDAGLSAVRCRTLAALMPLFNSFILPRGALLWLILVWELGRVSYESACGVAGPLGGYRVSDVGARDDGAVLGSLLAAIEDLALVDLALVPANAINERFRPKPGLNLGV